MERKLRPRNTQEKKSAGILDLLKYLLFSYIITGVILLLMALVLYRFGLTEKIVSIAMIVLYISASFLAGYLAGRKMGSRRFLWGLLMGAAYFLVLVLLSLTVNHSVGNITSSFFTTLLLCACGGMLGGMLSH